MGHTIADVNPSSAAGRRKGPPRGPMPVARGGQERSFSWSGIRPQRTSWRAARPRRTGPCSSNQKALRRPGNRGSTFPPAVVHGAAVLGRRDVSLYGGGRCCARVRKIFISRQSNYGDHIPAATIGAGRFLTQDMAAALRRGRESLRVAGCDDGGFRSTAEGPSAAFPKRPLSLHPLNKKWNRPPKRAPRLRPFRLPLAIDPTRFALRAPTAARLHSAPTAPGGLLGPARGGGGPSPDGPAPARQTKRRSWGAGSP